MTTAKKSAPAARAKITVAEFNALIDKHLLLAAQFGMKAEKIGPGTATLRLRFDTMHIRPGGTIAGPVQMALADVALYAVVMSLLGRVELAVTTSLNINFLRRPAPVDIVAHAKILKLGKRLAVGECALYSEGEPEMVAHVTGTYSIPPAA
jgi:uncharacterized protein (TIGR00369 family)